MVDQVKLVKYTKETIPLGKKIHASISGRILIGAVVKSKWSDHDYFLLQNEMNGREPDKKDMLGYKHSWVFRFESYCGTTDGVTLGKLVEDDPYDIF